MNENEQFPKPDTGPQVQPEALQYPNDIPTPDKDWSLIVQQSADQTTVEKFFVSDATLDFKMLTPDIRGFLAVMRADYLQSGRSLEPIEEEIAKAEKDDLNEEQRNGLVILKKYRDFLALHIDRKFSLEEEDAHYRLQSARKDTEEIDVILPATEPMDLSEIYNPLDSIAEAAVAAKALEGQVKVDQWTPEDDRQVKAAIIASQAPDASPRRYERIVREGEGLAPRKYERTGRRSADRGKRERD